MKFYNLLTLLLLFKTVSVFSQNMEDYNGSWDGQFENSKILNLTIEIEKKTDSDFSFKILSENTIVDTSFIYKENTLINIPIGENVSFKGEFTADKKIITGFLESGLLLYHIKLEKNNFNKYIGKCNLFMVEELKSKSFYLSVENGLGDTYEAYPIFGDDRFTGTWCANFEKNKDKLTFSDFKTGLSFKGLLLENKIQLDIYLGNYLITKIELTKSIMEWEIGKFSNDYNSKKSNSLQHELLTKMEDSILSNALNNTNSVLILTKQKMVYENYFSGYNENIVHDMRSASKSISSAVIGLVLDKKLIHSTNDKLYDYIPLVYKNQFDEKKKQITIKSLLTMSSGLDAIDFGIQGKSHASEDNFQQASNYTQYILEAKMINEPEKHANYSSANPYLLGEIVDAVVAEPVDLFIDKNLFQLLDISNYIFQKDFQGRPYFGGGMYLKPRDMMKFGQLYLNNGIWKNKRILSKEWIEKSFKKYLVLENTKDKNEYGFLWWHKTYIINGKAIQSIEARGAGGQYIFIIPKLDTVIVITSGNYRNSKTQQPEKILEDYILPSIVK